MTDSRATGRPAPATRGATTVTGELLDALPMAVVLVDRARRISGWNRAAEALYGYLRRVAAGMPFLELLFDADDRDAAAALLDAAGEGRAWEGDFRVRRTDGALLVSSFRLAPAGAASGFAWLATDGIDQGLAEQERSVLLSAERAARSTAEEALGLVEAILTSAPVGIAVFDLDLRYVRVNDAYAALSGVPATDHLGGRLGDALPLQADVAADLRRVVTTGRTILGRNVDLIGDPDGEDQRSFTVSYFPVRTTAGALVGAGLTLFEVTEARRAAVERVALQTMAEAAHQRLSILATASSVLTTTMEIEELLAASPGSSPPSLRTGASSNSSGGTGCPSTSPPPTAAGTPPRTSSPPCLPSRWPSMGRAGSPRRCAPARPAWSAPRGFLGWPRSTRCDRPWSCPLSRGGGSSAC